MTQGGIALLAVTAADAEDPQTLRMVAGAIANLCGNGMLIHFSVGLPLSPSPLSLSDHGWNSSINFCCCSCGPAKSFLHVESRSIHSFRF